MEDVNVIVIDAQGLPLVLAEHSSTAFALVVEHFEADRPDALPANAVLEMKPASKKLLQAVNLADQVQDCVVWVYKIGVRLTGVAELIPYATLYEYETVKA